MFSISESLERRLAGEGLQIFKYIVENSLDAILMTDSELQIVYSNWACNQLMTRNVIGQPLMSLWFEEDLPLLNNINDWARVGGLLSAARVNGFRSVIAQYPGIEIVGTLAADWNREKGRQAAEEFLRANPPGTLDVIWAASGEMGLGAMLAVEAAGRQDEVKIFTNDVTPESADRMREGRLMAETHHGFPEWGWYGTRFAVMLSLGQDVPYTFDIRPCTMYKDNADLFYPMPALESIDWKGIKAGRKLPEKIVIGWVPAVSSGVFKTATAYFEKAAAEARQHGINVEVITHTPATHVDFAGQVAIIEDYIQQQVDVIVLSTIKVGAIKRTIKKANEAGIPVIIVNQLEPIEGIEVASYIGFDNTGVGAISAYSVVDYLGGPGILGEGEKVECEPGTYLDLAWWQTLYKDVDPSTTDVNGRVAIIKGISGSLRGKNGLVRSDGSVVYVDSITFPVYDKAGQFVGLVGSFRDATQRKQAEEALRKAHDELEIRVEERTAELAQANKELEAEIAERKRAEEELKRSEEKYRTLLDSIKEGYFEIDLTGNFTLFNDSVPKNLGYSKDELLGMNNRDYMTPESAQKIYTCLKEVYRTGNPLTKVDYEVIRKDGKHRFHELSASLLQDQAGQTIGFRGVAHDITDRKRAEEALRRAHEGLEIRVQERTKDLAQAKEALEVENAERKRAEEELKRYQETLEEMVKERTHELKEAQKELVNKAMEAGRAQLSAMVLHNIGNAVTPLKVHTEQMKTSELKQIPYYLEKCYLDLSEHATDLQHYIQNDSRGKEVFSYMGKLVDSLKHHGEHLIGVTKDTDAAVSYISEILTLQHSYAAKEQEVKELTDLNCLIEDALQMQARTFERRGINVEANLDHSIPKLLIDKNRLMQVMVNLIKNSYEAINELNDGSREKVIRINSLAEDGDVGFEITDSGIGIEPGDMEAFFEFGKSQKGSLGVGLYYSKMFVEANNGTLNMSSPGRGKGATVRVVFETSLNNEKNL